MSAGQRSLSGADLLFFQHRVHQRQQRALLAGGQAAPFVQQRPLRGRQREPVLGVGKKLRERQPKGLADLFQRGKRWRHALLVPGGNGRLRQAGALRELIFRPAPGLAVFPDQAENVCHAITTYDFSFIIL